MPTIATFGMMSAVTSRGGTLVVGVNSPDRNRQENAMNPRCGLDAGFQAGSSRAKADGGPFRSTGAPPQAPRAGAPARSVTGRAAAWRGPARVLAWVLLVLSLTCPASHAGAAGDGVELRVGDELLHIYRARAGAVEPAERVALIKSRIDKLIDGQLPPVAIDARQEGEGGWGVYAGNSPLLAITAEDARLDGRSPRVIAEGIAARLGEILADEQSARSSHTLLVGVLCTIGYSVALAALLALLGWLVRLARRRIEDAQGTLIPSLRIKTLELLSASRIVTGLQALLGVGRVGVTVVIVYMYVSVVLSLFPWTARHSRALLSYVLEPLEHVGELLLRVIPDFAFVVVYVLLARWALKFLRLFFGEIEKGSLRFKGFYREWARPTYQLVRLLVIALTAVAVYPYIPGSNSAAFQGMSVFIGALLSFGSSSAVANVVAGLVLTYMRSFQVGDRVEIGGSRGDVIEKTLLITRIRTPWNVEVTIPNALVLGGQITNFSAQASVGQLILTTEVTLGYDVPWRQVHELLIAAARRTHGLLSEPPPFVLQRGLDDSYIRYQLNAYTHKAGDMEQLRSVMHQQILDSFNGAGVEILSPSYLAVRDGNSVTIPGSERARSSRGPLTRQPVSADA
jgi:small-conductance mechanosensitive channel